MADLPIGSIVMFDGVTPPVGWYDCDGSTQGGIQTPNLVGSFPMGVLASGGTLGGTGGSSTHTHINVNTGNQTHGHTATSGNSGSTDTPSVGSIWAGGSTGLGEHNHLLSVSAITGATSHQHTMQNTDAATSLPPYIRLRYIMRCE